MAYQLMLVIDLLAITILTLPLYYRRYRRRDLVTAFAVLNVGVFAVASTLGSVEVGLGLGMGLFGVLSIIRLRSTEILQDEVAYYFSALSIGLIAGLGSGAPIASAALIFLILAVVALVDARGFLSASRQQDIRLGRAITDEAELRMAVEQLLDAKITALRVVSVDLVNDTTTVDVRWVQKKPRAVENKIRTESRVGV